MRRLLPLAFAAVLASAGLVLLASPSHADESSEHAEEHGEHAGEHGGHGEHVPSFDEINWFEGLLFESKDAEPGPLTRKPGTPIPLGAMLVNSAILFALLIGVGGPKIRQALKARREAITAGIRQAAQMQQEAEERLREYEEKLEKVDAEIQAAKKQIRDLAKVEREQILKEAKQKSERMQRDARQIIEHELKAAREVLMRETVKIAIKAAREAIAEQATTSDEQRLQAEYLESLRTSRVTMQPGTAGRGQA